MIDNAIFRRVQNRANFTVIQLSFGKMRYKKEHEIAEVVRTFEDATITRDDWKHAEHLTVALHYLCNHDVDTATEKMRKGLFKLLRSFGVDLTKEMQYHETLTIFWVRAVSDFNASKNGVSLLDKTNELIATYDKGYPLRFYSREFLFSDEARIGFVEADISKHFSEKLIADSL